MSVSCSSLTKKGQVTIPQNIRKKLNLQPGSKVEFIYHENYIAIMPINNNISNLKGLLPKPDKAISIDEMDEVIKERVSI